ncbi:hypothetical protein [Myroides injenensis]|uniref:hypothetical protein n=1 Tax=Myroides injenensis TaxID=1183151 RepID=UPI000289DA6B|nr:hypothetical protein [Myroides injenensis]
MLLENKKYPVANCTTDNKSLIGLLLLQKRFYEANLLLEQEKESVVTLFNKGVAFYFLEKYAEALSSFQQSLSLLNNQLPLSTDTIAKTNIEYQFYNKEKEHVQEVSMKGITEDYLFLFTDTTKVYLLFNILLCMEKLELWSDIHRVGSTLHSQYKISFVQKLLKRSNEKEK